MSSIRISQLQTVNSTAATDFLVINDADDSATRKIRFDDFSSGFVTTTTTNDQTLQGGLAVGGTNIDLQSGGNVSIKGLFTSYQQNAGDLLFSGFKAGVKSFQVLADGNIQIGSGIGAAGAATADVELEATGTAHFKGTVMVHRDTGADYAFQANTGSTVTAQLSAAGTYEAGGSINTGGVPAIAVTAGGGVAMAGSYGSAGQVLVSQGASQPMVWQDQAGASATKGAKGEQGQKGATGGKGQKGSAAGLLQYQGTVADVASLPSTGNTTGDVYHVLSPDSWYAWNGSAWQQMNDILEGAKGAKGQKGTDGQKGATGTNAGKGEKGQKGLDGTKGEPGQKGATGTGTKGQKGAAGVDASGTKGDKGQKGSKGQKGLGDKGDKGSASGLFEFKGDVATQGELPSTGNTTGDVYRVVDSGELFAWNGTAWVNLGGVVSVKGEKGTKGEVGQKGATGSKGTKGDLGPTGNDGPIGNKGQKGADASKGQKGAGGAKGQKGQDGADTVAGANTQVIFNSSGSLAGSSDLTFSGRTLTVYGLNTGTGVTNLGGNVTLGAAQTSQLTFVGSVASNLKTFADNIYDLGGSSYRWKQLWISQDIRWESGTTSFIIQQPVVSANTTPRGLSIGDIWVHAGTAGSRSTYVGNRSGTDTSNVLATQDDVTCVGYSAGSAGPGKGTVCIGSSAGASLHNALGSKFVVAIGHHTLVGSFMNDVENTVAIGDSIGSAIRSGKNNIFMGSAEIQASGNTSGTVSIAYGPSASMTSSAGNVFIGGYGSDGISRPVYNPVGAVTNTIAIGSTQTTAAYIQVAWTAVSDQRDKITYGGVPHGLSFVDSLRPVAYQFKKDGRHSEEGDGKLRYGFLAQDIAKLEGDQKVVIDDSYADCLRYTSDHMIPILVNAIQDLKLEVDSLRAQLANN